MQQSAVASAICRGQVYFKAQWLSTTLASAIPWIDCEACGLSSNQTAAYLCRPGFIKRDYRPGGRPGPSWFWICATEKTLGTFFVSVLELRQDGGGHEETWGRLTAALSRPVYCVGLSALLLMLLTAQYVTQAIS